MKTKNVPKSSDKSSIEYNVLMIFVLNKFLVCKDIIDDDCRVLTYYVIVITSEMTK